MPEGARSATAVISMQDGVVLQDLPFDVELKKFIVDYYETGMPKLFASDIVIHDHDTGAGDPGDGQGQRAGLPPRRRDLPEQLRRRRLDAQAARHPDERRAASRSTSRAASAAARRLPTAARKMTLEFTGLRVINVENLGGSRPAAATDVRKVDLVAPLQEHLGSGAQDATATKELHNVGPSFSYKLRDAAGQAREFNNYMLPVELDGQRVFLAGARDKPDEEHALPAHPGRRRRTASTAGCACAPRCSTRPCASRPPTRYVDARDAGRQPRDGARS